MGEAWKICSSCRGEIPFGGRYWTCNVSTCNRKRTALYFCKVACWDAHLPTARHRSAWAVEQRAPSRAEAETSSGDERPGRASRGTGRALPPVAANKANTSELEGDLLVVQSRVEAYVHDRAQMSVSRSALFALGHLLRRECDAAIDSAVSDGRKTVMERDLPRPPAGVASEPALLVVSRMKTWIKARAGLKTSKGSCEVLSSFVRAWLNRAIREARKGRRSSVQDGDFEDC